MLLKKQNVFDDFAAAAEYLEKEKWTSPDRLVLRGGSNGGLLARRDDHAAPRALPRRRSAACRSSTWCATTSSAPARPGSPSTARRRTPAQFKALYAYSPYHHVKAGTKYPSVLLLSADSDDRVDPMHARKFAGALQAATTGGPVLLRIEKHAGHGGADLVKSTVEARADEYAFALSETPGQRRRAPVAEALR